MKRVVPVCLVAITVLAVVAVAKVEKLPPPKENTVAVKAAANLPAKVVKVNLDVLYLKDPRLPTIGKADVKAILKEGATTLKRKLGTRDLKFNYKGTKNIDTFFKKYLNKGSARYKQLNTKRYNVHGANDFGKHKIAFAKFLQKWKLRDLVDFFPGKTVEDLDSYEKAADALWAVYKEKVGKLKTLKTGKGIKLVSKPMKSHQSYINWIMVMEAQNEADIIFTNGIIVYDRMDEPYPHAMARYAKVGGASFESPKRKVFDGYSAMVNILEVLTDIEYFKSAFAGKKMDKKRRNGIVGTYLLAHEMGHMIYLIPDVYNHGRGCLMDSSAETLDYMKGYDDLKKYDYKCQYCGVYVKARNYALAGDKSMKKKKYKRAAREYELAARITPSRLDGDYNKYVAKLEGKTAKAYARAGDMVEAKKAMNRALQKDMKSKFLKDLKIQLKIE